MLEIQSTNVNQSDSKLMVSDWQSNVLKQSVSHLVFQNLLSLLLLLINGSVKQMATFEQVRQIVGDVLQLGERTERMQPDTALLGNIPEFDSMAVVSLLTAIEDEYGCVFEDDEINAEVFSTIGSLTEFVETKI